MSRPAQPQRTDWFSFSTPPLLFARARLFADRLELTGWHLQGRYRRDLWLRHILQVDVLKNDSLMLWLSSGETIRIHIRQAPGWKAAVEKEQSRL